MKKVTNVASVQKLSPFRYPGGKTWLVPQLREWLKSFEKKPKIFVEPFAGGAISSLTVAREDLAEHIVFCEMDARIASVWRTVLSDADWLCRRIISFKMNRKNVKAILESNVRSDRALAFQTIIRNRVQHGGIIAGGASLMKSGENGKGITSRWYPETLVNRIKVIYGMRNKLTFIEGDGFEIIRNHMSNADASFFIDPPYTAGGKNAGKRLYTYNEINHPALFDISSMIQGRFLMTYDVAPEVIVLAERYGFVANEVLMKNTHHTRIKELIITRKDDYSLGLGIGVLSECLRNEAAVNW